MKLIFRYMKKHIVIISISMLFLTMEALADLLQPTFMSYIVDKGIKADEKPVEKILIYGAMMLLIAAIGAFSAVMRNLYASRTSQTVGKELRSDMYKNVSELSLENIDRLQPASIITRITNDVSQVQEFVNGLMRIMVKAPITCVGAIVLIIIQTPRQAPVMGLIIVIVSILIFCNMRFGYPKFGIVQNKLDRLNACSREFLSGVRVVKAFRAEDEETEKFETASSAFSKANVDALSIMAVFSPLINLTVNMGIVLLLAFSGTTEASNIGRLMASVNYMTQVLFAVNMISHVINSAVRAVASSSRIEEILVEKPSLKTSENPVEADASKDIRFCEVSFSYNSAKKLALDNIDITIEGGKTLGIIGPTGSGKSTLVNLIPRFYDTSKGSILIGGVDLKEADDRKLRSHIAIVPQKSLLFTGTIRENLLWGNSEASEEELQEAAENACASEFIEKTENGYETRLGQGGVNLSGGQKQRLSLARALLRKPKLLILDDCTSALDAGTEARVLKSLSKIDGMTVLLISQRISTVMRADKILCLDNGRVCGFGTHEELLDSSENYKEIYKSQIGGI